MPLAENQKHNALIEAERTWGDHPASWPYPPRRRPVGAIQICVRRAAMRELRKLEAVFGYLTQEAIDRFWAQPGQSPYEDAGGAMRRRYEAMLGLPVERLPTYAEVLEDLLKRAGEKGES